MVAPGTCADLFQYAAAVRDPQTSAQLGARRVDTDRTCGLIKVGEPRLCAVEGRPSALTSGNSGIGVGCSRIRSISAPSNRQAPRFSSLY